MDGDYMDHQEREKTMFIIPALPVTFSSFTLYDLSSSTQHVLSGLFTWGHITVPFTIQERMEITSPY